jgi:hypothetical protein
MICRALDLVLMWAVCVTQISDLDRVMSYRCNAQGRVFVVISSLYLLLSSYTDRPASWIRTLPGENSCPRHSRHSQPSPISTARTYITTRHRRELSRRRPSAIVTLLAYPIIPPILCQRLGQARCLRSTGAVCEPQRTSTWIVLGWVIVSNRNRISPDDVQLPASGDMARSSNA